MTSRAASAFAVPPNVLMQELPDEETVFLNLATEEYFGLDRTGTAMYRALTSSVDLDAAQDRLRQEFDVDPDHLQRDLEELVDTLIDRGLLMRRGA